ncbi:MAG: choice-of-anchor D domain-containing protein [candidate division KSB1 bacterium]|nr:choice-of-anchor D domain-containing protein [candidate division KSB1 bacterium]MDZ7365972.1 choice-of-anchor D domain-containing protein [candidate division KSB1 bacterium]MDZ7404088.1 choice-of-anchor D domain-containing protein [candidate division KSB1 bacterium]
MTKLFSFLTLLLIFAAAPAPAQTHTGAAGLAPSAWPASRHDASMTARAQVVGPTNPQLKWRLNLSSGKLGSPVLGSDGTIYIPGNDNDTLYAVSPDGRLQWQFTGKKLSDELFVAPAIVGRDGVIYLGSTKNIFYAVNPDGSLRWSKALEGEVRLSATIGRDGTIYVAAKDCRLYAITPDGNIKWRVSLGRLPGNAPAIASDGTIYVVAGEFLKGYGPDGSRLLEVNCSAVGVLNGLIVDGFELIYVTALESPNVLAISNSGAEHWSYRFPDSFGPAQLPALGNDGNLYFASAKSGELFALNRNGSKRWSASPVAGKFLTELILDHANQIYIVDDNAGLISASEGGHLRWSMPEIQCQFSPALGADGTIYVASDKKLYAIGASAPKMVLEAQQLDWGEVCVGSVVTRGLKISNQGNADLQVNRLTASQSATSAGVFQIDSSGFMLPAGAQKIVPVKFTPADVVSYSETLTIHSNAGNASVALKGSGLGAKIFAQAGTARTSDSLHFGEVMMGKSATHLAKVFSGNACALRIDSVKIAGLPGQAANAAFSVETTGFPKILSAGDTATFTVRFAPAALSAYQARLLIYNNDRQRNPFVVVLQGIAVATRPDIEVTPQTLAFGKTCNEKQLHVVVTSTGEKNLQVDSLVFSNPAFFTDHPRTFTVAAGQRDTIRIRFKPVAGVISEGALVIFSNDANKKSVTVALRGQGDVPVLAVTPMVEFGAVEVQTCAGRVDSAAKTYVIGNDGGCDLRVDSLITSGAFSVASPSLPQIIPPQDSLNVVLKFTPTSVGVYSGTLRIVVNSSGERQFLTRLHGRGVAAPDIAVATDTLDFGAVPVGSTQNSPLTISNLGEIDLKVAQVAISSSRFTVAAQPFVLACNQDSAVTVAFSPDSTGLFTATLSITSNDSDEATVNVFLRGQGTKSVQAIITTNAPAYHFPALCIGSLDSLQAVVTNKGSGVLRVDSVRVVSHQQVFSTAVGRFEVEPQQSKTLTIFFKPQQRAEYTAALQFFSNASNSRLLEVKLHGSGSAAEISGQSRMAFAPTDVDSARRDFYLLNNLGDCPLTVIGVKIEGAHANDFKVIEVGPPVIVPQGSSRLALEFKPSRASARQALLVITSSDPVKPRFEVTLNGVGNGLPGKLSGPNRIDFGKACLDESIARECIITNTGQSDLTVTQIMTVRGELFKISGAIQLPKQVLPQDSVVIPLSFTPRQAGAASDTLLVQADLAANALFRVALQGAGRDDTTKIDVSHQAVAFNSRLDETKTEQLTITNAGCAKIEIRQIELARKLRVFSIYPELSLPVTLERDQSLNVTVSFKGDDFRSFADSLYIYCVDWRQNLERLGVNLLGKVMDGAPCLQVATAKLDFGEVAVGQAKRLDLQVTNCSADSRIIVRALQPAGGDFKILPDTLTIFPQNPQFFAVNFAPQRHGERVDTLKLVYSALSDPGRTKTQKIVLAGTATGNRAFARPNAFTPNGDGKNDEAKIHFTGYDPATLLLRVYDLRGLEVRLLRPQRRGELEIGWDGRDDRGALLMPGAYLWLLEDNGKKVGSGQLVLIR